MAGPNFSTQRRPAPDRLVGHREPALGQQVLDVPVAEREAEVEPGGMLDDHRRELVAGTGDGRHPGRLWPRPVGRHRFA